MGNLNPAQMFEHSIIERSGRSTMHALDFAAEVADGESVYEGGVLTLNANGQFVAGLGDGVTNTAAAKFTPVAIFANQATNDYDANSDPGNISGGKQSGLVATGGYEIETTEFVANAALKPNVPITFGVGDLATASTPGNRGKVVIAADAYSTQHVVGVVSLEAARNAYRKTVLSFWTVFCPAVKTS